MKLGKSSQLVLVMLLGIAFFEMGITQRFGKLWNLAFQPVAKSSDTSSQGVNPATNYTQTPPLSPDDPNQQAQNQNVT